MGTRYELHELPPIMHKGLLIAMIIEKPYTKSAEEFIYLHLSLVDYENDNILFYKLFKTKNKMPLPSSFILSSNVEDEIKRRGYAVSKRIYSGIFNSILRELED